MREACFFHNSESQIKEVRIWLAFASKVSEQDLKECLIGKLLLVRELDASILLRDGTKLHQVPQRAQPRPSWLHIECSDGIAEICESRDNYLSYPFNIENGYVWEEMMVCCSFLLRCDRVPRKKFYLKFSEDGRWSLLLPEEFEEALASIEQRCQRRISCNPGKRLE